METARLELEITGGKGAYQVFARSPAGGDASATMHLPFDDQMLRERLLEVELALAKSSTRVRGRLLSEDETRVQAFGRALFEALFVDDVRGVFDISRQRAADQDESLGVVLRIRAPELARLPWEFLYDPRRDAYLGLTTSLVRYSEVMEPVKRLMVSPPLKILGMAASPADLDPLDTAKEHQRLSKAIARLELAGRAQLNWEDGQTWGDLQRALYENRWHVFHFVGHGGFDRRAGEGILAFADEDGSAFQLGAAKLGLLLRSCPSLRLVVLNSCDSGRGSAGDVFSSTAAVLVRTGIPAVVAMQFEISDEAAIRFAQAFYEAVAAGQPVDEAMTASRVAVNLSQDATLEWGTPVLYLRSPDARLFDVVGAPARSVTPSRSHSELRAQSSEPSAPVEQEESNAAARPPRLIVRQVQVVGTEEGINAVAFSPDGHRLATGTTSRLVWIWDAATGQPVLRVAHKRRFFRDMVISVAFSPDGRWLASASDNSVVIWDATTGKELVSVAHDGKIRSVAFSPDARWLATGCFDTALIWDATTGKELVKIVTPPAIHTVAFSFDGRWLATGGMLDKSARIWDAITGSELVSIGHDEFVTSVAFSPARLWLATASNEKSARIWDATTGKEIVRLDHAQDVRTVTFSPDGWRLATVNSGPAAQIWDLEEAGSG